MMRLIEGTRYKRRKKQPTPTPPKSKEALECLLCSDPGDDDDAQVGHGLMKRSRPIGLNICLEGVIEDTYYNANAKKIIAATAKITLIM